MSKIAEALEKNFETHRVIFWYDEAANLMEEFEALNILAVEKIYVQNNEFEVKYRINRTSPNNKFLLYFTGQKPSYEANWLLDMELAHYIFRTDQEAVYLQEIRLDYHYKELVTEHLEFFKSQKRRLKLRDLLDSEDAHKGIRQKMLSILFEVEYLDISAFIQAHATAFYDGNEKFNRDLTSYNLNDFYWSEIKRKYKYEADKPSIYDFLIEVFKNNFVLSNQSTLSSDARLLLLMWKENISNREYFGKISEKIALDIGIESKLEEADIDTIIKDDLFKLTDMKIISDINQLIINEHIGYEKVLAYVKQRENKYWYNDLSALYKCLLAASAMIGQIRKSSERKYNSVKEGTTDYANNLYEIDQLYRKFIFNYRKFNQNRILADLAIKVEKVYSNDWLLVYNNNWQAVIDSQNTWQDDSITNQKRFFAHHVKNIIDKKQRLFVVISDALRYEAGAELAKLIQAENRFEASISYLTSSLPSYTQLGMASLLPNKSITIQENTDNVLVDGMSSIGIQGRSKILETNSGVRATAITAEEFMKKNANKEGRDFVKDYDLIYIYHNRIDKTGDDKTTEEKVFEAVERELEFLMDLNKKIANMNGTNIFITADHGFLYQNNELDESDFSFSNHSGEIWKENRRFIIGKNLVGDAATKSFKGSELGLQDDVDILIPKSINRLRVKGAGSRFIHGGASLQEIIVPLIKIRKKKEDTTSQIEIDIIKSTDKITTNILAVSFLQIGEVNEQVLSRKIQAAIYANDEELLSDQFTYNFDIEEGSDRAKEVKHRFQLSSKASSKYKNQQVKLILKEPIEGANKWKQYNEYTYFLNISFTNDFDDF
jgi:uncharacterized protein (TIGR02687 family)